MANDTDRTTQKRTDQRDRVWANEEPWDRQRIEGFAMVSPDTEEVNWPRDVIRAHRAAHADDPPELPANVRSGRLKLEAASATARLRHDLRIDTGSPGQVEEFDSAPIPDEQAYWEAHPSPVLHPDRFKKVFPGLDLLVTPTGPPIEERLTRKQRREGALEMIAEMADSAVERLRTERSEMSMDLGAEAKRFATAAQGAASDAAETITEFWTDDMGFIHPPDEAQARSPAMTGPYRSARRFLEGRKVNGVAILMGVVALVAIGLFLAFGYMLANWVF